MADAALFGIAKSILKQLGSPAMEEIKLLWNHNTQLKNLMETITTISMVLQDAERQQESNAIVKEWLERLKVVLYDADDFFDTVSAKALQHKAKYGRGKKMVARLPFSKMYHFAFVVKSAHKVKDIRERIDAIAKDITVFNFLVSTIGRDQPERTRRDATHSYVPSKEVVGREQEKEDIVKMLLTPPAEREGVYVIAVIGIGGLGKTTVAQFVYGDDRIERNFDLRMWACINDFSCLDQVLMAFGGKHQQHPNSRLEVLGQQIVKKCANVPLLILTIASFLRYEEESKWCSLVDGEFPTVVPGDYTKVMQVLKVSYREFPYPVKRCFAFCSLFPKDYFFKKDALIHLWVAEGFIEADDVGQSLEDKAEEYFFYLEDRCFFQNVMRLHDYGWEMHDLVHDLAKEVAGSESISVDDIRAQKLETRDRNLRHVSLLGREWSHIPHPNSVRTFLQFHGGYKGANNFLNKQMSNFKALRVLDLFGLGIKQIPASIGKLTHLRLLDLSENNMERLPSSICSLLHLQTLILRYCSDLKELPEEIGRLISLRHLILDYEMLFESVPAGLAALTSLVTLDKPVVHKPGGDLRYLECLNNLSGSLRILIHGTEWEDVVVDAQRASLSRKNELKVIQISFKVVESGGQVEALMDALKPHPNLEYLNIKGFGGNKMPRWFTCLDRLVVLELKSCERVIELPPLSRLRSLKELRLGSMPSLHLPSLESLYINDCAELETVCLAHLTALDSLTITNCGKLGEDKAGGFKDLTSIESLEIDGFDEGAVQWQLLHRLKKMQLSFKGTSCTRGHLDGFEHLTNSLEHLTLRDCTDLYLPWTSLVRLRLLRTLVISKVERVIDVGSTPTQREIQQQPIISTSLRYMLINHLGSTLPEGIKHLSSLQFLSLYDCKQVMSLPCWINSLSSHCRVEFCLCSEELKKRCQEPTGEDWPLIQHLESVHFYH
ncbi:hypothetical protein V2J09_016997 [Rumex salicifolius]